MLWYDFNTILYIKFGKTLSHWVYGILATECFHSALYWRVYFEITDERLKVKRNIRNQINNTRSIVCYNNCYAKSYEAQWQTTTYWNCRSPILRASHTSSGGDQLNDASPRNVLLKSVVCVPPFYKINLGIKLGLETSWFALK